jgi:hypothetical protein
MLRNTNNEAYISNKLSRLLSKTSIEDYEGIVERIVKHKQVNDNLVVYVCDTIISTSCYNKYIYKTLKIIRSVCGEVVYAEVIKDILCDTMDNTILRKPKEVALAMIFMQHRAIQCKEYHVVAADYYNEMVEEGEIAVAILTQRFCRVPRNMIAASHERLVGLGVAGICPECGGAGQIEGDFSPNSMMGTMGVTGFLMDCQYCNGLGYTKKGI